MYNFYEASIEISARGWAFEPVELELRFAYLLVLSRDSPTNFYLINMEKLSLRLRLFFYEKKNHEVYIDVN